MIMDLPASVYWIDGFHEEFNGKNGCGDPWSSNGRR
jgi:hypothetical protein